jgi:hypothetical protein
VARASDHQTPVADSGVTGSNNVEKCFDCQFYDRRRARPTDGKAPMWGQCRRHSPQLNTVTTKTYVVEGVWPLVRDDDWCGEWKVLTRTAEDPIPETVPAPARGRPVPVAPATTVAAGDD